MHAVQIHQYGSADVLQMNDIAIPEIKEDEVLIKVVAASVNPVDWKIREGKLQGMNLHTLPLTLGWDASGTIEKIGSQVKNFKPGDEVFTRPAINRNGTYAEYASVKANEVAMKPKSISHIEAASLPLAGITAYEMLHSKAKVKSGNRVLIHAGSGGVGTLAIQIAKAAGCYVAATTSTANIELVKRLGADEVIDYKKHNFVDLIKEYDVVLDTLGGQAQEDSWQVLRRGGVLVSIVSTPSEKRAAEHAVRSEFLFIAPNVPVLNELSVLVEAGKLKPVVGKVLPLSAIKAAHDLSESGRAVGKICLEIG